MKNILDQICRGNQTHILYSITFSENRAACEIMWKNMAEAEGSQMTWRIRVACWISKATSTHPHAHAQTPTRTHASTRTHTQTNV
jgi:uncharacterized protein YecE (DUF72 family)